MTAEPKYKYTLAEYFALESDSEEKFEYWDENVCRIEFTDCQLPLSEICRDVSFEPTIEIIGRNNEPTNAF